MLIATHTHCSNLPQASSGDSIPRESSEEPFYLNLKQLGTHWELDQEAIMFVITEKALNAGIDYPKIVTANLISKSGPAIITAPRGTIEAVYATGEFIVAAGHNEDGETREVDLVMEIGAIADSSRARKMNTGASKEINLIERELSVHITVKLNTVEEMYYVRERHVKKAWEDLGFMVSRTNQQLVKLKDGTNTTTRSDLIHANIMPMDSYNGDLLGADYPSLLKITYGNSKETVTTKLPYKIHAKGELAQVLCTICHRYTPEALEGPLCRRLRLDHVACQGHAPGKGKGYGKGRGKGDGRGSGRGGGRGKSPAAGTALMIEKAKAQNALKAAMHGSGASSSGAPLEPCKHFWQGKCIRAKSDTTCNFAHGTRADAKRILCRHHQIRGACRYGDKCHYATQAEYDALDWDAKVPLDAVGPHHAPTPAASPIHHTEGAGESLV